MNDTTLGAYERTIPDPDDMDGGVTAAAIEKEAEQKASTTDPFTTAAREYAESACYQDENRPIAEAGFLAGCRAARSYLAAQEPDDAEVKSAADVLEALDGMDYQDVARGALVAARRARGGTK